MMYVDYSARHEASRYMLKQRLQYPECLVKFLVQNPERESLKSNLLFTAELGHNAYGIWVGGRCGRGGGEQLILKAYQQVLLYQSFDTVEHS